MLSIRRVEASRYKAPQLFPRSSGSHELMLLLQRKNPTHARGASGESCGMVDPTAFLTSPEDTSLRPTGHKSQGHHSIQCLMEISSDASLGDGMSFKDGRGWGRSFHPGVLGFIGHKWSGAPSRPTDATLAGHPSLTSRQLTFCSAFMSNRCYRYLILT
jgi:hypothetical protein